MNESPRLSLESYRLEILSNALTALTEEIQITLLRSAYSQVVKEAQDASCAIFTAEGRIVAQPVVIPGHLGSMKFMLAEVLKDIPTDTLLPGDVLVSNDPYRGGSHLPDIAVFRPIFFETRLVGFAGCIVHYTDVGGMVPGSNPQRATELYQEGLVIPPSKLYEAGQPNVSLHRMIKANVRDPDIFFGDMRAQEAAFAQGRAAGLRSGPALRRRRSMPRHGRADRAYRGAGQSGDPGNLETACSSFVGLHGSRRYRSDAADPCPGTGRNPRMRKSSSISPVTDPQVKGPLNAAAGEDLDHGVSIACVCILPDDIAFNDGLTKRS